MPLRLALVALAASSLIIGVGLVALIASDAWALDIERYIKASHDLLDGRFGTDRAYLYSPLAALLTMPLTLMPIGAVAVAWLVVKVGLLGWGIRHETRGIPRFDAALAGIAVFAFIATSYDLLLGNVTVFVLASIAIVVWRRDDWRSGIILGVILATAPKPQLIPILIWMALFRRRALAGSIATAAVLTALAILVVGWGTYLTWFDVLRSPLYLESRMEGNLTPDAVLPAFALPIKAAALVGFVVALRRGEWNGLIAAVATGLLVAPYTLAYAAMLLLLAVRPLALAAPRITLALAALGSAGVILLMPIYALGWLLAGVFTRFQPKPDPQPSR